MIKFPERFRDRVTGGTLIYGGNRMGKYLAFKTGWIRYVVMIIITTGSGMDFDTYSEEYTGVEYCSLKNAQRELKEAQRSYPDAYILTREVTKI